MSKSGGVLGRARRSLPSFTRCDSGTRRNLYITAIDRHSRCVIHGLQTPSLSKLMQSSTARTSSNFLDFDFDIRLFQ